EGLEDEAAGEREDREGHEGRERRPPGGLALLGHVVADGDRQEDGHGGERIDDEEHRREGDQRELQGLAHPPTGSIIPSWPAPSPGPSPPSTPSCFRTASSPCPAPRTSCPSSRA